MNPLRKAWQWIRGVFNRYESAWQGWGERSWLQQSLQDARFDIDAATRQELQRRHRYWVSNSQLVQKIRSLFIQFTVGPSGLKCTPNSADESWNESRAFAFESWGRQPEICSLLSLSQCTIQWAGQLFDDGEFFIVKTVDERGRPALQTIEAHRVVSPSRQKEYRGMAIVDGVVLDKMGKPQFYCVKKTPTGALYGYVDPMTQRAMQDAEDDFAFLPAKDVIHKFKARRPGQIRGIPEGFSCMNVLHDFDDLQRLEMQCAKLASEIATIETNPTGELDTYTNRRNKLGIQTQDASGNPVTKNIYAEYQVTLGGKRIALKSGDKLENFMVNRPTVVQQAYWDLLLTQICCGYNVPKLLVMPYSLQGTVTRADLDICANAFRASFEPIKQALREIYEWQCEWANKFDRTQDGVEPVDYWRVVIRPPRAPNVDIGYNAKALETELSLGIKTVQDIYAERQQDWRTETRQIAEYLAFVNKVADEFGIDASQITKLATKAADPEPDGDEPKPNEEQINATA